MAEKKTDKKIIDVQHPGKSAPSDNSKSVIVKHGPIMKDPMVVEDEELKKDETKITVKTSKSIKPLSETPAEDEKKTVAEIAVEAAAKKDDKPEPEPNLDEVLKPATHDETPPEEAPVEDEKTEQGPTNDPDTDSASSDDTQTQENKPADKVAEEQAKAEEEKKKKEEAVQKLVDSKQYFLPINSVEKRKSKRFVALGIILAVLLAVAWADIALDAGLIQINGIKPVTHFFSN
jgi:hypothetical protein